MSDTRQIDTYTDDCDGTNSTRSVSSLEDPANATDILGPSLATKPPARATSVFRGDAQSSDSMAQPCELCEVDTVAFCTAMGLCASRALNQVWVSSFEVNKRPLDITTITATK